MGSSQVCHFASVPLHDPDECGFLASNTCEPHSVPIGSLQDLIKTTYGITTRDSTLKKEVAIMKTESRYWCVYVDWMRRH